MMIPVLLISAAYLGAVVHGGESQPDNGQEMGRVAPVRVPPLVRDCANDDGIHSKSVQESIERIASVLESMSVLAVRSAGAHPPPVVKQGCPDYLEGPDVPCVRIKKHCFCYNTRKFKWADAALFCRKHRMNLVTLDSAQKENLVVGLMPLLGLPTTSYWSSGSDAQEEGTWVWTATGQLISRYRNWHKYQPDDNMGTQDCLSFPENWRSASAWDDRHCDDLLRSVCEA